jgi:hypothetical protein
MVNFSYNVLLVRWQVQFCRKTLTILASQNPLFEDKAFQIIKITLEQKMNKQSSPWVSPPKINGVLQASPLRNESKLLESPLPTKNHS